MEEKEVIIRLVTVVSGANMEEKEVIIRLVTVVSGGNMGGLTLAV